MNLVRFLYGKFRRIHPDHKAIAKGMVWVSLFVLLGKFVGAAKEMAIAYRYGTGVEVDAFLFVLNLVSWPVGIWFSSLTVVLVPLLVRIQQNSFGDFVRFRAEFFGLSLLLGGFFSFISWQGLPYLLQMAWVGLPNETAILASGIIPDIALVPILGTLIGFFSVLTLASGRHLNTLFESLPALATLLAVMVFSGGGTAPLVWGTLTGFFLNFALLGISLLRRGEVREVRFSYQSQYWPAFCGGVGIMLAGQVLMGLGTIVDQFFAVRLAPGAIATLSYAQRILSLILAFGAMAVARATLPVFSRTRAQCGQVRRLASQWSWGMFFLGCLTLAFGWWMAPKIVKLLFERGAFAAEDTILVTEVFRYGLLQLPFYFSGIVLVSCLASQGKYRVLTVVAGVNLVVKILSLQVFVKYFELNGVMLSTSLMYASSFFSYLYVFSRKIDEY